MGCRPGCRPCGWRWTSSVCVPRMQETGKEPVLHCLALFFFLGPLRSDGNGGYVAAKTALRSVLLSVMPRYCGFILLQCSSWAILGPDGPDATNFTSRSNHQSWFCCPTIQTLWTWTSSKLDTMCPEPAEHGQEPHLG